MKTNTFIFNFINPARLVYLAKDVPVEKPADKGSGAVAEDISGVGAAAAKVAEEKGRIAAEAAKKATGGKKEAEKKELEEKIATFQAADDLNGLEKLAVEIPDLMKKAKESGDNMALADFAGLLSKTLRAREQLMTKAGGKSEIAKELLPTKEMVDEIFKDKNKRTLAKNLLEEFLREGYSKGKSAKYNFEVINILGKQKESSANKDKWVRAFQEWVGATPDGETGPKTIMKLATKVGEGGLGRKIEGTMIARGVKKSGETKGKEQPAVVYATSPIENEAKMTLTKEAAEKEKNLYKPVNAVAQSVMPNKETTIISDRMVSEKQENYFDINKVEKASGEKSEEVAVASAETENRPAGTYENPDNPNEAGSYDANEAPEGWDMLSTDEENAVTLVSKEEPKKKPVQRRERNVFDNMNAYIDESTGRS